MPDLPTPQRGPWIHYLGWTLAEVAALAVVGCLLVGYEQLRGPGYGASPWHFAPFEQQLLGCMGLFAFADLAWFRWRRPESSPWPIGISLLLLLGYGVSVASLALVELIRHRFRRAVGVEALKRRGAQRPPARIARQAGRTPHRRR